MRTLLNGHSLVLTKHTEDSVYTSLTRSSLASLGTGMFLVSVYKIPVFSLLKVKLFYSFILTVKMFP